MHVGWIQAACYNPPTVLGRKLLPFSPFHALTLDAVDSPYMRGTAVDVHDLILAVYVCSRSWADRASIIGEPEPIQTWGAEQDHADWLAEMAAFRLYFQESWTIPDKWETGDKAKAKANGAYHLAVFGMRFLSMTEAAAWDCPVSRLICYRETYSEQETGKSLLKTDDELEGIAKLKAEAAAAEVPSGTG